METALLIADYSWANTTGQLVLWGGNANNGAICGLAFATSDIDWSYSSASVALALRILGI